LFTFLNCGFQSLLDELQWQVTCPKGNFADARLALAISRLPHWHTTRNGEWNMNSLRLLIASTALALCAGGVAQGQGMVDMSKLTCEQLLKGTGNSIETAIWFSGYYNGLRKNTKMNLDQFQKNAEVIVAECRDNLTVPVMKTIGKMMSGKK
jgi:hypothetical protein